MASNRKKFQFGALLTIFVLGSLLFPIALFAQDGTQKWAFQTGSAQYSSPAIGPDGTIYVGASLGDFYAINPDGTQKWELIWDVGNLSSPAIGPDGTLYINTYFNTLYAINPDGTRKWQFFSAYMAFGSSAAVGVDGTIYIASNDGYLCAINPDGTQKWAFQINGSYTWSSPAIGADGTIYVSADFNLYAINPNGTLKWTFDTQSYMYTSPAITTDGTIYMGLYNKGNVYAINPDGTQKWAFEAYIPFASPAIGSDGTIYSGSYDGYLYAINPDGTQKWAFAAGDTATNSPAIGVDGTIYIGSHDFNLYAINPDGTQKWAFQTGGTIDCSPAIGPDGTIYIVSNDGNLYAINGSSGGLANSPWPMFRHDLRNTGQQISNDPPNKPILTLPFNGATGVSLTPTLQTGNFSDPNSRDKHIKTEWQLSTENNFSSLIIDTTSLSHLTIFTVPTLLLVEGSSYYWRVRFYDNHDTASEWSGVYSFTTLTTTNDFNSNGIPDEQENPTVDMDDDGTADIEQTDIIKSLNTVVGDGQMGTSRRDEPKVIAIESIESIDPDTISEIGRPDTMYLGLFAIRITVANPGDSVEVPVYFSKAAPGNARWYMYDSIHGWVDYSEKGLATFSGDRKSVLLTLKDGGNGDADGIANGVIVDPGGFGFASWIKGFVSNASTTEGIISAKLTILDLVLKTTLGGYYLSPIIPGTYSMSVSASGYGSMSASNVVIGAGDMVTRSFGLYSIGDINNDGNTDLTDVILAMQILTKVQSPSNIDKGADVNGDAKIGLEEVIYTLQSISGLR